MFKVLILYKSLPQYRISFFDLLRQELYKNGVILELIYGDADLRGKNDCVTSEWAIFKPNKYLDIGITRLTWQPCLKEIKSADLVIVEQADRLLINYVLILRRIFKNKQFAFWGHGLNRQAKSYSISNIFKRFYINKCDWWFAYTEGIKSFLIKNGYPSSRITTVQNAIDTQQMNNEYFSICEEELNVIRRKYNMQKEETILIYCGALYKEKRIDFLIDTIDEIVKRTEKVKLVVLGGGPDENIIKEAALTRPYLIYAGPRFGREKATFFKLSTLFLLPGSMGLAILDSFAFETPIITTKYPFHGPELEYLVDGQNGIITENTKSCYIDAVEELLKNKEKMQQITENCIEEIGRYSNERMVANFMDGIKKLIGMKKQKVDIIEKAKNIKKIQAPFF